MKIFITMIIIGYFLTQKYELYDRVPKNTYKRKFIESYYLGLNFMGILRNIKYYPNRQVQINKANVDFTTDINLYNFNTKNVYNQNTFNTNNYTLSDGNNDIEVSVKDFAIKFGNTDCGIFI